MANVEGHVAERFAAVGERFREHFQTEGEVGASLCVWHKGEIVIDLAGGTLGLNDDRPWTHDTLVNVFSVTKGMVATVCLWLQDRGELDLDAPISEVWPEFTGDGKAVITWRQVLNHTSGMVAIDTPITLEDLEAWEPVERALEAQAPLWKPGDKQGYHAITFGLLLRAAVRKLTGRSIGDLLASEIAGPLGADVYLGLPEALDERVATLVTLPPLGAVKAVGGPLLFGDSMESRFFRNVLFRRSSPGSRAVRHPKDLGGTKLANFNQPRVRRMELPWANAHASARGLARVYQMLVQGGELDGVRVLSAEACRRPIEPQSWVEVDETMRKPLGFSQGFIKEQSSLFSPSPGWFGHPGIGGSLGYADPDEELSFAYVMNRLRPQVRSPTALALSRCVYDCLGKASSSS
ncbi:MAG: class A beta-lactamase-related serine hydrolase [Deltaproteobacteria bacterium]|nr:MAG: class A beta-lactamase-related serine hydrolase [Deltaproteobacteria bacterium]